MDSATLTIVLFLFASALLLVVEAVKTSGRLRYGFSAGAGAFVLLGLFWTPVARIFPEAAKAVGAVASFAPSWFFLGLTIFLLVRDRWASPKASPAVSEKTRETDGWRKEFATKLTTLTDDIRVVNQRIVGEGVSASTKAEVALTKADFLEGKIDAAGHLIQNLGKDFAALEKAVDRTLKGMRAIGHRERLKVRSELVAESAAKLVIADDVDLMLTDWAEWRREEELWRRRLMDWLELADLYGSHVSERVMSAPPEAYLRDWAFDEGMIASRKDEHRYKTFLLINANYEAQLGNVMGENFRQAYNN